MMNDELRMLNCEVVYDRTSSFGIRHVTLRKAGERISDEEIYAVIPANTRFGKRSGMLAYQRDGMYFVEVFYAV